MKRKNEAVIAGSIVLSATSVCKKMDLSRTTLWRMQKRGEFPPARKISRGRIGWIQEEVESYLNDCGPSLTSKTK